MESATPEQSPHTLPEHEVNRAARLSYAQAMLGAIFVASTGGMFLVGYALKMGASNAQIGLISSLPMVASVVHFASAAFIERGVSRKRMTIYAGLLNVLGWGIVAGLPLLTRGASTNTKINVLIGLITIITAIACISGGARASWIGELIPADRRGVFFGKIFMFGGLIATLFALVEGHFLDIAKNAGIGGFSWLFLFGMLFGLVNILLFLPQPDIKLAIEGNRKSFAKLIKETIRNRPMMVAMAYTTVWSLQVIAAPFYNTYMLRDLKMPFLGVGVINAATTLTMLSSATFWGRMVDRFGCRPVLTLCSIAIAPIYIAWLFVSNSLVAYCLIIPMNLYGGFWSSGVSVSLNTLVYKITPTIGRSVQFAVFSVVVMLIAAPMPIIGGHLPDWLKAIGIYADLRATFGICIIFVIAGTLISRHIQEEGTRSSRDVLRFLRKLRIKI